MCILTFCNIYVISPQVVGVCKAAFPVWGFDNENATCVEFVYRGCGGNLNAFESKEECEEACSGEK